MRTHNTPRLCAGPRTAGTPIKFWNVASIGDDEGEITLYGDVVSRQPVDWWTGEPEPGLYIAPESFMEDLAAVKGKSNITIKINTVTLGQTNTLTIGSEAWLKVVNGSHTLKIVATDAKDASVTRTLTFTKAVTSVEFEQTLAMEADAMPTKALVNIQGNFPAGCTLQVWICNNGNDTSPTWEDITQKARTGQKHYFTNKTKTAAAWGVKVKAKLLRGSATETCYIQSIGGNFA